MTFMENRTLRNPSYEERQMFTTDIYPVLAEQLVKYKKTRLTYLLVAIVLLAISFFYHVFVRDHNLLFTIFVSSPLMIASMGILNNMDEDIAMATEILACGREGKYFIRDEHPVVTGIAGEEALNSRTIVIRFDNNDEVDVCTFHEEDFYEEEEM